MAKLAGVTANATTMDHPIPIHLTEESSICGPQDTSIFGNFKCGNSSAISTEMSWSSTCTIDRSELPSKGPLNSKILNQTLSLQFFREDEVFNNSYVWRSVNGALRICFSAASDYDTGERAWDIIPDGMACAVGGANRIGFIWNPIQWMRMTPAGTIAM